MVKECKRISYDGKEFILVQEKQSDEAGEPKYHLLDAAQLSETARQYLSSFS